VQASPSSQDPARSIRSHSVVSILQMYSWHWFGGSGHGIVIFEVQFSQHMAKSSSQPSTTQPLEILQGGSP